jgi:hypothetical protein
VQAVHASHAIQGQRSGAVGSTWLTRCWMNVASSRSPTISPDPAYPVRSSTFASAACVLIASMPFSALAFVSYPWLAAMIATTPNRWRRFWPTDKRVTLPVSSSRRQRSGVAGCFLDELYAGAQAKFGVDVGQVGLHGAR